MAAGLGRGLLDALTKHGQVILDDVPIIVSDNVCNHASCYAMHVTVHSCVVVWELETCSTLVVLRLTWNPPIFLIHLTGRG